MNRKFCFKDCSYIIKILLFKIRTDRSCFFFCTEHFFLFSSALVNKGIKFSLIMGSITSLK